MFETQIQYVTDQNSKLTNVLVPIDLWREIEVSLAATLVQRNGTAEKHLTEALQQKKPQRPFGSAKGQMIIMPDFDEPLEEFKEYM